MATVQATSWCLAAPQLPVFLVELSCHLAMVRMWAMLLFALVARPLQLGAMLLLLVAPPIALTGALPCWSAGMPRLGLPLVVLFRCCQAVRLQAPRVQWLPVPHPLQLAAGVWCCQVAQQALVHRQAGSPWSLVTAAVPAWPCLALGVLPLPTQVRWRLLQALHPAGRLGSWRLRQVLRSSRATSRWSPVLPCRSQARLAWGLGPFHLVPRAAWTSAPATPA